ncbi:MAG: DUF2029 domain-containing protein [Bacteroidia bacterium]
MPKWSQIGLFLSLGLLIAFNVFRWSQKDWNYADPIDFRGLYLGAELFADKQEIYNDSLARNYWLNHKESEQFESHSDFGDQWVSIMLYPPHAIVFSRGFSQMSWKQSRIWWWILCALSICCILILLYLITKDVLALYLVLAFKGTFFAIALGQPMLLVFAFLLLAVLLQKKKSYLAGIFLGLAMIKFNLAIPFGIWFLLQGNFKLIGTAALTAVLLFLPAYLMYPDIISNYMTKVNDYYVMLYNPHPLNMYTFSNSEITILLDYYFNNDTKVWKLINYCGQFLGYLWLSLSFLRKRMDRNYLLLGLLLVSFVFSYHLSYDALILLLPILLLPNVQYKWISIALFIILSLPWNAVFENYPIIKFNYPLILIFGLLLFIFANKKTVNAIHS